jgi:hypothetical protein
VNGLEPLFGDVSGVCRATQILQAEGNKLQLEALRTNPLMDGYCLHAFTDGDWVLGAGVLDLWRQPKLMYQALREVNQPRYLAVHVTPRNAYAPGKIRLKVTSINEGEPVRGPLLLAIRSSQGKVAWKTALDVDVPSGIAVLFDQEISVRDFSGQYVASTSVESSGKLAVENSFSFLVMAEKDLLPPKAPIALIDPQGRLKPFFAARGIACQEFAAGNRENQPVLVAAGDPGNLQVFEQYARLMEQVKRGGVAMLLDPPLPIVRPTSAIYQVPDEKNYMRIAAGGKSWNLKPQPTAALATGLFPFHLEKRPARGTWIPVLHYLKPSPIFRGLPPSAFMGQPYQNVCASNTLIGPLDGETLAGSVSWNFIEDYRGPTDLWWGADLAVVPHGKGKLILSTLQILENLGKDPIAEKLLYNLIDYAAGQTRPLEPVDRDFPQRLEVFKKKYRRFKAAGNEEGLRQGVQTQRKDKEEREGLLHQSLSPSGRGVGDEGGGEQEIFEEKK